MKWYDKQKQLFAEKNAINKTSQTTVKESYIDQTNPLSDSAEDEQGLETYSNDRHGNDTLTGSNENEKTSFVPYVAKLDTTTIGKGTLLTGNVEADGDLIIHGTINGDIICNKNLSVFGTVQGTITCSNAYFEHAKIIGDVSCNGNLQLTESSAILGNVEAIELQNGGRIKGNTNIHESAKFTEKSVLIGDISANDLIVERGAVIQGNIQIRQEISFDI